MSDDELSDGLPRPDEPIVEVYVAANAIEAYGLADALEEEGIQAKVVNDEIGQAGGVLPLGWVAAPRVWVHQHDREAAMRLIGAWSAAERPSKELSADEPFAEDETVRSSAAAAEPPATAALPDEPQGRSVLGRAMLMIGVCAIAMGGMRALFTYLDNANYPAEAPAELIEARRTWTKTDSSFREMNQGVYRFEVDGHEFSGLGSETFSESELPSTRTAHYNPRDPTLHVIGPLPTAWPALVAGLSIGGLLLFIVSRME